MTSNIGSATLHSHCKTKTTYMIGLNGRTFDHIFTLYKNTYFLVIQFKHKMATYVY